MDLVISSDPIAALVDALRHDASALPAWVTRWSEGGREPVATAWPAAHISYASMLRVLKIAGWREVWALAIEAVRAVPVRADHAAYLEACCEAIRRVAPIPPTLSDLVDTAPRPAP